MVCGPIRFRPSLGRSKYDSYLYVIICNASINHITRVFMNVCVCICECERVKNILMGRAKDNMEPARIPELFQIPDFN